MGGLILVVIIGLVVYWLVGEGKRKADEIKNSIVGERGYCIDCKYCLRDNTGAYSSTGYFCRLCKCQSITQGTIMDCVEKATVTEEDLQEIFKLKYWTTTGEQYIRNSLLGKKMGFTEVDAFLSRLPHEHPEYMRGAVDENE